MQEHEGLDLDALEGVPSGVQVAAGGAGTDLPRCDGEEGSVHLGGDELLHGVPGRRGTKDVALASGNAQRGEEGQRVDGVPVSGG